MPTFNSLPGFRDFFPDDLAVRNHIFSTWRKVASRYGFQEYDGPPLEATELYIEKSGPEIVQQLYNFIDKGDRAVALRPEMTPTLARMVGARAGAMRKPIKWFSIPQLFRYERAQRGRLREHFQLNLDIVGEESVSADVELIAAAIDVLRAFGLTHDDFVVRVSDRRLLRALLAHAGVPGDRLPLVYNIVDKLERETPDAIADRLGSEAGLEAAVVGEVLAIFGHRDFEAVRAVYGDIEEIADDIERMDTLLRDLHAMGLGAYLRFDLGVVRGLAYYTGVVFEIFDVQGKLRAIAGGGRYDDLLSVVSDADLPALGFGMGDVVLRELLIDRGLLQVEDRVLDYYVVTVAAEQRPAALRLVHELRDAGHSVEYGLRQQGVGKQLKAASAAGARTAVIIGPEEIAAGEAVVKEMESGNESRVSLESLYSPESA